MQGGVEVTRTLGAAVGHNGRGEKRRPWEPICHYRLVSLPRGSGAWIRSGQLANKRWGVEGKRVSTTYRHRPSISMLRDMQHAVR